MFEKVIEWAKANAAEGADVTELEGMLPTVDDIMGTDAVRRAFDSAVSKAVNNHDERFRSEKLPELIEEERAKIRAELNPEETPEQRRIRELEEKLAKRDRDAQTRERRDALRKKASELKVTEYGLQPDDVEVFAGLGDDGEKVLESLVGRLNESFNTALDRKLKERYTRSSPSGGDPNMDEIEKLRAAGKTEEADRMQLAQMYSAKRPKD
jgi:hypothetical protein